MTTQQWLDVSNFTNPLTPEQLAYVDANVTGVIIGLQSSASARAFQQQFAHLKREYYVDRLGRDLSIPEPGSRVWIDIEAGCFTAEGDVLAEVQTELADGIQVGVYGNATSIVPVMGSSTVLSQYPLWWANYGTPDEGRFAPFNGWTKPTIMQYSSNGVDGINADLDIVVVEDEDVAKEYYEGELDNARSLKALSLNLYTTTPTHFDPQDPTTVIMTDLQGNEIGRCKLITLPDYDKPN